MNCQDNSRLKVPLPELCKTTDIGCVPATDGKPDCPPEADQLPLAYDINSQTLWIFSCESRNWTPLTKFSLAELQEVSLDNLRNICNLVNVPVFYNLGQGTIQGSLSLGELAEKIVECRGITPGPTPTPSVDSKTVVAPGENVTVTSATVGDTTTYTVNAVVPPVPTPEITVVEAGSNTTVTSNKVGNVTTYTVSATGGGGVSDGGVAVYDGAMGNYTRDISINPTSTVDYGPHTIVYQVRTNEIIYGDGRQNHPGQQPEIWSVTVTNPFSTKAYLVFDTRLVLYIYWMLVSSSDPGDVYSHRTDPRFDIYHTISDVLELTPDIFGINTTHGAIPVRMNNSILSGASYTTNPLDYSSGAGQSSNPRTNYFTSGSSRYTREMQPGEVLTLYSHEWAVFRSHVVNLRVSYLSQYFASIRLFPSYSKLNVRIQNLDL